MLQQRIAASPPELTDGSVRGAWAGSDQEIFLWCTLSELGCRNRWGTEANLVTPIGWRTKPDGSRPVGKITATIDSAGQAIAGFFS